MQCRRTQNKEKKELPSPMRILIAEDQKDLNKILTKKLTAEGYSVDS